MKNITAETILYYEKHAEKYVHETINVNFTDIAVQFCNYIPNGGNILDVGCGSGRDAKYFLKKGYQVTAFDGSKEMSRRASEYLGMTVVTKLIQEYVFENQFDGIWCCASLLHLHLEEIEHFILRARNGLKREGYMYVSFKYGTFQGIRDGRYYTDLTERLLEDIVRKVNGMEIVYLFKSSDTLKDREQSWLNAILKKQEEIL